MLDCQDLADLLYQPRQVICDRIANDIQIHLTILVHQDIPHAYDISPWDFGVLGGEIIRKTITGLSHQSEVIEDTPQKEAIGLERLTVLATDGLSDQVSKLDDVKKVAPHYAAAYTTWAVPRMD